MTQSCETEKWPIFFKYLFAANEKQNLLEMLTLYHKVVYLIGYI